MTMRSLYKLMVLSTCACTSIGCGGDASPRHEKAVDAATVTHRAGSRGDAGPMTADASGDSASAAAVIGPEGGELSLSNMRLLLPAGALSAPQVIQVTVRD